MAKIRLESLSAHLALLVLGKLVNIACLFLLLRASTLILSSEELGRFYLLSSFVSLFFLVFVSPVGQYFFRMSNRWFLDGCLMSALDVYSHYVLCVSICTLPIAFILAGIIGLNKEFTYFSVVLMSCSYVLTFTWFYTVIPIMNMVQMRVIYSIFYMLSSVLMLLFPVLFIYWVEPTANLWLMGTIVAMGLMAFLGGRSLRHQVKTYNKRKSKIGSVVVINYREAGGFIFPVLWVTLFTWVQIYGFRVSIENNFGVEYLAYLGLGLIIGSQVLSVVESVGTQFFYPIFYRRIEECSHTEIKTGVSTLINSLLPIYFLCSVYVSCFSREVFWLVSSEKYLDWHWVLSISIWAEFFRLLGNLLSNVAHAVKNTRSLIFSYASGAVFLIVGVSLASFWPEYLSLVVWVYFFGMLVFVVFMYYCMNKLIVVAFSRRICITAILLATPLVFMSCFSDLKTSIEMRLSLAFVFGLYVVGACLFVVLKLVKTDDSR